MNINALYDFMLTEKKMMESIICERPRALERKKPVPLSKAEPKTEPEKTKFIYPTQKDTLFWCFYIMKHGYESYEMLGNINLIIEKKIKIDYVELLRKNKHMIKTAKIAPLVHIENYLVNEPKIDIKTFLALCIIEKQELLYLQKNTYFLLSEKDTDDLGDLHIIRQTGTTFGVILNEKEAKIKHYIDAFFRIENMAKPIKAPSAYKVGDLLDIAKKIGIEVINSETNKQQTKNELYEQIVQYF